MKLEEIVQQAHDNNVRLFAFMYCDIGGIIRTKATHISSLARRLVSGIGVSLAMQAMSGMD